MPTRKKKLKKITKKLRKNGGLLSPKQSEDFIATLSQGFTTSNCGIQREDWRCVASSPEEAAVKRAVRDLPAKWEYAGNHLGNYYKVRRELTDGRYPVPKFVYRTVRVVANAESMRERKCDFMPRVRKCGALLDRKPTPSMLDKELFIPAFGERMRFGNLTPDQLRIALYFALRDAEKLEYFIKRAHNALADCLP